MFNMVDMDMFYIVLFISWVMCFVCGAALGNYKYCGSYMGFLLCFLLGWIGVVILLCLPSKKENLVNRRVPQCNQPSDVHNDFVALKRLFKAEIISQEAYQNG